MRGLIHTLQAPANLRVASAVSLVLLVIGGLCCTVWSLLLGEFATPREAGAWAAIIFLPWYAAFEINKRLLARLTGAARRTASVIGVLGLALLAGALMEKAMFNAYGIQPAPLSLHLARHFPETIIVALFSVLAAVLNQRQPPPAPRVAANDLPISAERIRWIKSAGNYVEIATPARVEMHRMTLGDAERLLDPDAFVRVNRSTIVARSQIVRVKPGARAGVIELTDGRAVPIGQAYRANFADAA